MPNGGPGKQPHAGPGIAGSKSGYCASGDAASASGRFKFKVASGEEEPERASGPGSLSPDGRGLFPQTGGGYSGIPMCLRLRMSLTTASDLL